MNPQERDPRIYFAAERTFLAWIRTGLALMGFGFVVARFGLFVRESARSPREPTWRLSGMSVRIGTGLVLIGAVVNVVSALQHVRTIRGLNTGHDVTGRPSLTGITLAVLLAVVGVAMSAYLITAK